MRSLLALFVCMLAAGCASREPIVVNRPAVPDPPASSSASRWPDDADYNAIAIATRVRDQALRLTAWNEKAYAAQLGMSTLVTLEHTMRPGRCATFVAHLYDELMDLNQAYPREDWRPMVRVVAHGPSVASRCAPPARRADLRANHLAGG
jgi:hypothetical protein